MTSAKTISLARRYYRAAMRQADLRPHGGIAYLRAAVRTAEAGHAWRRHTGQLPPLAPTRAWLASIEAGMIPTGQTITHHQRQDAYLRSTID